EEWDVVHRGQIEEGREAFIGDAADPHLVAVPVRLGVPDVLDLPGLPRPRLAEEGPAESVAPASEPRDVLGARAEGFDQPEHAVVVEPPEVRHLRTAEPRCALEDRPEAGL